MAHSYDHESVQELLSWARNLLQNKSFPEVPYQLNISTKIINCSLFLETVIATIEENKDNSTFQPTIEQLWHFRDKIEGKV